jgi:uncharacterized membrane protein YoaK (UPF0700 family)
VILAAVIVVAAAMVTRRVAPTPIPAWQRLSAILVAVLVGVLGVEPFHSQVHNPSLYVLISFGVGAAVYVGLRAWRQRRADRKLRPFRPPRAPKTGRRTR